MPKTQTERQKIRDEHPETWVAVKEGDTIAGKIVDVTDAWSDQRRDPATNRPGSPYPLLTIQAAEATGYDNLPRDLKVHCFGAILYNEIMRKQPPIGERVRITYQGPGEAKPGQNPPERYSVRAGAGGDVAARAYGSIEGGRGRPLGVTTSAPEPAEFTPEPLPMPDDDIPY